MFGAMIYIHIGSDYNEIVDYVLISFFGLADLAFFVFWVALVVRDIKNILIAKKALKIA